MLTEACVNQALTEERCALHAKWEHARSMACDTVKLRPPAQTALPHADGLYYTSHLTDKYINSTKGGSPVLR
jgi:hypothetical protein